MAKWLIILPNGFDEYEDITEFELRIRYLIETGLDNSQFRIDCSGDAPLNKVTAPTINEYKQFMEFVDKNEFEHLMY